MKKHTLLLFSILSTITVFSQEVISTQGDSYSNSNGSIDFTVGEPIINTLTDGNNDLTQGFHQTNWHFVGIVDHTPLYEATIFPNPAGEVLNIESTKFEDVIYSLYDAQGKLILVDKLDANVTRIQVSKLAPGRYSIILSNQNQSLKTFNLIKTY